MTIADDMTELDAGNVREVISADIDIVEGIFAGLATARNTIKNINTFVKQIK